MKAYFDVIENVRSTLESIDNKEYQQKFERILNRNVGFDSLMQIKDILYGNIERDVLRNEYVTALSSEEIALFKFSVVTSVDVERSFSTYKSVLTEKRRSFTFEHFKQHLIFACNNNFL